MHIQNIPMYTFMICICTPNWEDFILQILPPFGCSDGTDIGNKRAISMLKNIISVVGSKFTYPERQPIKWILLCRLNPLSLCPSFGPIIPWRNHDSFFSCFYMIYSLLYLGEKHIKRFWDRLWCRYTDILFLFNHVTHGQRLK